jgi:hypothetical protein
MVMPIIEDLSVTLDKRKTRDKIHEENLIVRNFELLII